jgi:hypothetical protein
MDWFDIVLRGPSHEISGYIAMQHLQLNFVWHGTNSLVLSMLLGWATPVLAGTSDPLLDDGPTVPCAARVDYSGGIDVNGNAVVPADVGSQPVPVPEKLAVPLPGNKSGGKDSAYVALDGKKLKSLVNPPACH